MSIENHIIVTLNKQLTIELKKTNKNPFFFIKKTPKLKYYCFTRIQILFKPFISRYLWLTIFLLKISPNYL